MVINIDIVHRLQKDNSELSLEASKEIILLRQLAEDMYIVLSNEIGDNSVTKAYQAYIERHQND
jgi:hypothetical protein